MRPPKFPLFGKESPRRTTVTDPLVSRLNEFIIRQTVSFSQCICMKTLITSIHSDMIYCFKNETNDRKTRRRTRYAEWNSLACHVCEMSGTTYAVQNPLVNITFILKLAFVAALRCGNPQGRMKGGILPSLPRILACERRGRASCFAPAC